MDTATGGISTSGLWPAQPVSPNSISHPTPQTTARFMAVSFREGGKKGCFITSELLRGGQDPPSPAVAALDLLHGLLLRGHHPAVAAVALEDLVDLLAEQLFLLQERLDQPVHQVPVRLE